ncbi:MAG: Nif11-like leader peptide family natural product precursor [Verrucomicrobiae bacterium]
MSQESAKALVERMKSDEKFRAKIIAVEDASARAKIIQTEGFDCSAEEISAEASELSDEEMARVAGGAPSYKPADL